MTAPTLELVQSYYDERVEGKLRDFTGANPRIEAAIQVLAEWAPLKPSRILEIGCGIGATSWRMARAWPQAEVVGVDVSPISIEVATTCFRRPNLRYWAGLVKEGVLAGRFDLVVLMDTYEHIALGDRAALHGAIRSILSEEARLVLTFPTPALQNYGRTKAPTEQQPVDEDITLPDILRLAEGTGTNLVYYREVGIWHYGDYAHAVLGRYQPLTQVALREYRASGLMALKKLLRGLFRSDQPTRYLDYLGSDVLRPSARNITDRFKVRAAERERVVSAWFRRSRIRDGSQR